jgi:putative ABC transport system substrate-binding protein
MRRRDFITLLGSTAAWPLAARAQQPTMPIIGFLSTGSPNALANLVAAFRQGLNEIGYVEHRNVGIEYRWAEGQYDRLPALAAELVRRQVAVIAATGGGPSPQAAKAATATIPIVFHVGGDPVAAGLVASFARPGGNITGVVSLNPELVPKRLELLREVVPTANLIAVLINPRAGNSYLSDLPAAARTLGLQLQVLHASSDRDFDPVFADLVRLKPGALLIGSDPFFNSRIEQLAALALRHRLPAIYQEREFAAAGGMAVASGNFFVWSAPTPAASSRARSRPTCRSSSRQRSS